MNTDDNKNNKYLFTGQEFDGESELYYYNARYYNPLIGRFISVDPMFGRVGNLLARNEYVYALNNPLKYVDPSGETTVERQQELELAKLNWTESLNESFENWVIDVGNGGEYLYNNNTLAKTMMDHPVMTGLTTGIASGAAFAGLSYGATAISTAYLGGVGTSCILGGCQKIIQNSLNQGSKIHSIYVSINDGVVDYVGRTNDFARRAAEHLSRWQSNPTGSGSYKSDFRPSQRHRTGID